MQKELLMLRLTLISATLFSFLFGLRYQTIFLDVQTFNFTFIVINSYLSFNLVMKLVPPKFSLDETNLYNKYFYRYFKPIEFRKLMDIARRRVFKVNSNIVNQGNGFSSLFFVAGIVGESVSINIKSNGSFIKGLNPHGWVGIVEYIEVISEGTISNAVARGSDFGSWGVSVDICFNISEQDNESITVESQSFSNESEEKSIFECDINKISEEVIIYEFDLEVPIILF